MEILMGRTLMALLLSLALGQLASGLQPIEVQGSRWVNSATGERFHVVGVDYQPGGQSAYDPGSKRDPLSDGEVCLRDAALLQRLGVNTVRIYNLDPTLNHDLCASIFNGVGIYMLIDVNSPLGGESLDRTNPGQSYHTDYLKRIFGIVEAFKGYPNTLGFFGGNEVINDDASAAIVPPYLRAVQRDLKRYIARHSTRPIPVGYSAAELVREMLASTWQYLQCALDGDATADDSRADFFGLNTYAWCESSDTYQTSGYEQLVALFANTSIPVFFSEYGCNRQRPRTFNEVQALYGPDMTPVMSGGLIYEFSQEESDYGLVTINDDGTAELLTDYDNLQQQYGRLDISALNANNGGDNGNTTTTVSPPSCDASLIEHSRFNSTFEIPSTPDDAQELIDNGIPNPNQGALIEVTKTQVSQRVQDSGGRDLSSLSISLLPNDQINTPAPVTTLSSATASSPTSTSTPTGAASAHHPGQWSLAMVPMLMTYLLASMT